MNYVSEDKPEDESSSHCSEYGIDSKPYVLVDAFLKGECKDSTEIPAAHVTTPEYNGSSGGVFSLKLFVPVVIVDAVTDSNDGKARKSEEPELWSHDELREVEVCSCGFGVAVIVHH